MALLTSGDRDRVSDAVAWAEARTGGEIITAVIAESDDYAARELLFGLIVGVLAFILAAFFAAPLQSLLDRWFWNDSALYLPLALMTIALVIGGAAYALAQIPAIDRLIVGRRTMTDAVRRRALRHFTESAAYDTVDRTGVLLFISVLEHRVELIADRGINAQVAPDTWDRIVSSLVRGLKEGRRVDSIVAAVDAIGTVLAEHVPRRDDDENELPRTALTTNG